MRAALRARELGAEVTLLESARLGGTAFNEGPAPVRTLARAARLRGDAATFAMFGLDGPPPRVDLVSAIANANRVAAHANEVRHLPTALRRTGVEVVDSAGPARFVERLALGVADGRRFEGDSVILCVGGSPRKLPIPGSELALSFHDLWSLRSLPGQVTVVGGASTGCQLASILRDFGAEIHLVEAADRIVPQSDVDVSRALEAAFSSRGIRVLTQTRIQRIEAVGDSRRKVAYRRGQEDGHLETDAVFLRSAGLRTSSHWTSECRASSLAGHTSMSTKRCARMCRTSSSPATRTGSACSCRVRRCRARSRPRTRCSGRGGPTCRTPWRRGASRIPSTAPWG